MVQLAQNISVKQTQNLAMTQALQQSLKMLQMSSLDLADVLAAEMEKNPLLTSDEGGSDEVAYKETSLAETDLTKLNAGSSEEVVDHDYASAWDNVGKGGSLKFEDDEFEFGANLTEEKDLREDLYEQFCMNNHAPQSRAIASYMLDFLDGAGYFIGNIAEIATTLGCEEQEIEQVLKALQKLEPVGIFARNLEECLRIQLEDKNRLDPAMFVLLSNLQMLAMRRFDTLMSLCNVGEEDLEGMVSDIKSCNPKPALGFNVKEYTPAQPDVYIRRNAEGSFVAELNNAALPRVLVNKKYAQEISAKIKDKAEKQFVRENLASANFLVRALDQRANTMIKTAVAIVRHQEEFFRHGIKYLKPLTLSQIAEEVGLHESTISRVTTNKYMQTPRGSFEMKYFFTSGVSSYGSEIASTSVKEMIKEMIEKEEEANPLSDDMLTKLLGKKGVKISRRTVMKYRESMGVSSSYARKKPSYIQ